MPYRATSDADLLGFGASDLESVAQVFQDIAAVPTDDFIMLTPTSVVVEEIRKEAGLRQRPCSDCGRSGQGTLQQFNAAHKFPLNAMTKAFDH
jgi:hypothetical protein